MIALGRLVDLKDSLLEIILIVRCCLTTFWFWVPVLYAAYFFVQLWMFFYIHPLTIVIFPAILIVYSIFLEEKRFEAKYGLIRDKTVSSSAPLGSKPTYKNFRWNVEQALREYNQLLKETKHEKDEDK